MDRQELQVQATELLVVECRTPRNPAVISHDAIARHTARDASVTEVGQAPDDDADEDEGGSDSDGE